MGADLIWFDTAVPGSEAFALYKRSWWHVDRNGIHLGCDEGPNL
jgi:hypothetical protein